MRITTVKQLKQLLANVPDDVHIIKQNNETGCIEDAFVFDTIGVIGMCGFSETTGPFTHRYILVK